MVGSSHRRRIVWWGLLILLGGALLLPYPEFAGKLDVTDSLLKISAGTGLVAGLCIIWASFRESWPR